MEKGVKATVAGFDLVVVEWVDSRQSNGSWRFVDDVTQWDGPVVCMTAGWLIEKTDDVLVVAQSLADVEKEADGMQIAGTKIIPARCVVKITKK